tara:strand:- start:549 stop:965 length:417 start_codon:yes stop_codon:yes gene_type:complete
MMFLKRKKDTAAEKEREKLLKEYSRAAFLLSQNMHFINAVGIEGVGDKVVTQTSSKSQQLTYRFKVRSGFDITDYECSEQDFKVMLSHTANAANDLRALETKIGEKQFDNRTQRNAERAYRILRDTEKLGQLVMIYES